MSDEDYSIGASGAKGSSTAPGKHRGPRFTWNAQYEATFFRSLCESVSLGLREGSTFKPEAWDRAIQALIDKHHAFANKGHLINKSDNARKKYRLWRGLREDPTFYYNPATRMVTATEDSWARHLQKEPLARSLKGRPFDHEEFYEILFPDVIGSGGAPKRLTKPRRKGPDNVNGTEEQDAPGTSILDMLSNTSFLNPNAQHMAQSVQPVQPVPASAPMTTTLPSPVQQQQLHRQQPPATMAPPPQPRTSVAPTTSALTPPEENPTQGRKRQNVPESSPSNKSPEKRRRTVPPNYIDLQQSSQNHHVGNGSSSGNANNNTNNNNNTTNNTNNNSSANNHIHPNSASSTMQQQSTISVPVDTPIVAASSSMSEGIHVIAEALRVAASKNRPAWQEQAMDIFFRDFPSEDPDLQLKIAEKLLTDENKAMFFCKMPETLRKHWVKRLREVHNRVV